MKCKSKYAKLRVVKLRMPIGFLKALGCKTDEETLFGICFVWYFGKSKNYKLIMGEVFYTENEEYVNINITVEKLQNRKSYITTCKKLQIINR